MCGSAAKSLASSTGLLDPPMPALDRSVTAVEGPAADTGLRDPGKRLLRIRTIPKAESNEVSAPNRGCRFSELATGAEICFPNFCRHSQRDRANRDARHQMFG